MAKQKPVVLVVQNIRHVLTIEPTKRPARKVKDGESNTR